jgi:tetratricopeptide (TPR) repeat protein
MTDHAHVSCEALSESRRLTRHLDWATLASLIEGVRVEEEALAHLARCVPCQHEKYEVERMLAAVCAEATADGDAEKRFQALIRHPIATWRAIILADEAFATTAAMRRIVCEAERALRRRPATAVELLEVAERWLVPYDDEARLLFGDIARLRSIALLSCGPLADSLEAAEIAEIFYASLDDSAFYVGQARSAQAMVLARYMRCDEALRAATEAEEALRPFGNTLPLARAALVHASILVEAGRTAEAEQRCRELIPALQQLGAREELARLRIELAECVRIRGAHAAAVLCAQEAVTISGELHMESECIHARWMIGKIATDAGDAAGVSLMERAAADFVSFGMYVDATRALFDIVEALIRKGSSPRAATSRGELVECLTRAGAGPHGIDALSFFFDTVANSDAALALFTATRDFVLRDDPAEALDVATRIRSPNDDSSAHRGEKARFKPRTPAA